MCTATIFEVHIRWKIMVNGIIGVHQQRFFFRPEQRATIVIVTTLPKIWLGKLKIFSWSTKQAVFSNKNRGIKLR